MSKELIVKDDMSLAELGAVFVKSGFFQDARDASQAIVKILAGKEMGFGPIASMTGVHIIKGKPSVGANLIAAAIKRSGRYDYLVKTMTDEECVIEFYERSGWHGKRELIGVSTFNRADATKASTQNVDKFPRNMFFARAMSNGAKWFCADVFGGPIYTPDELGVTVDEEGEVIDHGGQWDVITPETPIIQVTPDRHDAELEARIMSDAPAPTEQVERPAAKKCTIKTSKWAAMLVELQTMTQYYNGKGGAINGFHATGAAAKCGYDLVTDENIEIVYRDLIQYALEQQALDKALKAEA